MLSTTAIGHMQEIQELDMLLYTKSENKNAWIEIDDRDGETVTIASATFDVVDDSDVVVQTSISASLADNGTVLARIFGRVDATQSGFVAGSAYKVRFTYLIGTEQYQSVMPIKIRERKL
jgi:hypothetical protein